MDMKGDAGPEERFDTITAAEAGEHERSGDVDRAAEIVASMADATPLRSVAAVVVGFVALTIGSWIASRLIVSATGIQPGDPMTNAFLYGNLASRLFVAAVAGVLTSRAAPNRPLIHGVWLAGLVAFLALAGVVGLVAAGTMPDPAWYPVVMLFVGPIGVLAGATIQDSRIRTA